jgi:transposase
MRRSPQPAASGRQVRTGFRSRCPCCGGKLVKLGEDITETLEVVPRQWKVIQTVREKFSCRACEKITQPPAPFQVIPRARAGASLLAMIPSVRRRARDGGSIQLAALGSPCRRRPGLPGTTRQARYPGGHSFRSAGLCSPNLAYRHDDDTTVPVLAKQKP